MQKSEFESTLSDLKAAARAPECRGATIRKATGAHAVTALRALQEIAAMPVGRNPMAEAQRMRAIAIDCVGASSE